MKGSARGMARWCQIISGLALAAFQGVSASDFAPPVAERTNSENQAVFSAGRRFAVMGFGAAGNVALAADLEDVAARLEQLAGTALPLTRHNPVRVVVGDASSSKPARVIRAQGWVGGMLQQKLMIENPGAVERGDILDGICWLLLNRWVVAAQSEAQRQRKAGETPDWLAVGVSRNLYPEWRAASVAAVVGEWRAGRTLSVRELWLMTYLPPGHWIEKDWAACGVAWMMSRSTSSALIARLCGELAATGSLPPDWIAQQALNRADMGQAQRDFDLWMARQAEGARMVNDGAASRLAELRAALQVRPAQLGVPCGSDWPASLALADLIARRHADCVPALADRLCLMLGGLAVGQPAEFRAVIDQYTFFSRALARCGRRSWFGRLLRPSPAESRLRSLLANAEKARLDWERSVQARTDYLDRLEVLGETGGAGSLLSAPLRAYLDAYEGRAQPLPQPAP